MSETVQEDLGLTAEQRERIKDIAAIAKQHFREFATRLREVSPPGTNGKEEAEARNQKFQSLMEESKTQAKELTTKALAVLTVTQTERLKQIHLQTAIAVTLKRPEVIQVLNISKDQQDRIQTLCDRNGEIKPPALTGLNPEERRQKLIALNQEINEHAAERKKQLLDVLTQEQRAKLEKFVGKLIEPKWSYDFPEDIGL
jgi:hypothetical protein